MSEIHWIPVDKIDPPDKPIRRVVKDEEWRGLRDSIVAEGNAEVVSVAPLANGRYMIIGGNRRYEAAKDAGVPELRCDVRDGQSPLDILVARGLENSHNARMSDREWGEFYKDVYDGGMSTPEISAAFGVPDATLYALFGLVKDVAFASAAKDAEDAEAREAESEQAEDLEADQADEDKKADKKPGPKAEAGKDQVNKRKDLRAGFNSEGAGWDGGEWYELAARYCFQEGLPGPSFRKVGAAVAACQTDANREYILSQPFDEKKLHNAGWVRSRPDRWWLVRAPERVKAPPIEDDPALRACLDMVNSGWSDVEKIVKAKAKGGAMAPEHWRFLCKRIREVSAAMAQAADEWEVKYGPTE